ncbi:MAG: nucleoside 2-deoxyribosyltransferase [Ignavibacteria bacterium GWA2_54_16]|nr:MAG: nucleoside 2-deoxyribosyltransferase [Ignavibacteria bacterium GWA2_54_16]
MRPDFRQFETTIRRGKGTHVPQIELGVHPRIKERFLGRPIVSLEDDVAFWLKAGYDYVKLQPGADFNPGKIGIDQNLTFNEDGTLFRKWATENSGVITSREDLENYQFPSPQDFDYSRFERIRSVLPGRMGVIGQYGDIFTMTWEMMGFESFSLALFENPELVTDLNESIGRLVMPMFEYFALSDAVDVLWYTDDIAFTEGLLVSPDTLRTYFFPWLRKIGDLARKSRKPLLYHTDGILWDVFDEIIDCGVDAIHPIEPKAMDIVDVKKRYGDKLCLLGNVDVDILARGTKEQIRSIVKENIEKVGYNGGYCVGSGNSIPEYVPYDNYLALLEASREFGEM